MFIQAKYDNETVNENSVPVNQEKVVICSKKMSTKPEKLERKDR